MNLANKYVGDQENKKPIRIVITLDGGIVQNVLSDIPAEVIILDYDTDDCDLEEETVINVYDDVDAVYRELSSEVNSNFVTSVFNSVKNA